ncbi:aspartic-type endopeptidase [Pseudohyphozyma bogoriensis]|nr:aspartic-type endopeptidase [Pseudohyphozyma bogoriensis]
MKASWLPLVPLLHLALASPLVPTLTPRMYKPEPRPIGIPISKSTAFAKRDGDDDVDAHLARLEASVRGTYAKYGIPYPEDQDHLGKRQSAVQDLVLATSPCTTGCLYSTPTYYPAASNTSSVSDTTFSITYGTGAAQGVLARDVVHLGNFTIDNQVFAACDQLSNIVSGDMSGILGMGWSSIANTQAVPLVQQLWQNNELPEPVVGFAFARWNGDPSASTSVKPGGIMTVGGINRTFFDGELNWININSESFWGIPLEDITLNGETLSVGVSDVTIDTGTSLVGVPLAAAQAIYAGIPGAQRMGTSSFYAYPCSEEVNLAFTFGGVSYAMDPSDFNTGLASSTSRQYCVGAVFVITTSGGGSGVERDMWIFGDAFLKNVYSAYRFSPASVGFAPLKANTASILTSGQIPRSNASRASRIASGTATGSSSRPTTTSGAVMGRGLDTVLAVGAGMAAVAGLML